MLQLTAALDGTKNPVTKFARDNKIECQLIKAGLPQQTQLHLALVMQAFKATSEYNA